MISQLRLFQFKGFKDQVFNFSNLTLLTGINGMGKSSVIQSLLVLRNSFDRGELQSGKSITISDKELVNLVSPDDMLYADASSDTVSFGLTDDHGDGFWSVASKGTSNSLPIFSKEIRENIFESPLFLPSFQYLNAERIGPRQSYERLTVSRDHSILGYRGEYTASVLSEAAQKLKKVMLSGLILEDESTLVYDQVSLWISRIIYPGTKVNLDDSNPSSISLQYTFAHVKSKGFNPLNIGFGFSFALPVIVSVLTAAPNSLIVVENPEAHLHPKGQAEMGRFLGCAAQSGLQIIVETHSDHILNGIRLAVKDKFVDPEAIKIIFVGSYLSNGQKHLHVSEPEIDSDGRIDDWPKDFFDTWEYSMMHLL